MIKMSTSSLVFIKSDHGDLSTYPSIVTPSFGLHRPPSHNESFTIATQKLIDRVHSQPTGIAVPRLAISQYVPLPQPISVVFAIHALDETPKKEVKRKGTKPLHFWSKVQSVIVYSVLE